MVKLILGEAGSGKTKQMLEMANKAVEDVKGEIAYIESTSKHSHLLQRDIRLIATEEVEIDSSASLYGLICGLISANYDIEKIFIDGLGKIIASTTAENIKDFIKTTDRLASDRDIEVIIATDIDDVGGDISKELESYTID